jgi:hypothetical protein
MLVEPVEERVEVRDALDRLPSIELEGVGEAHEELVPRGGLGVRLMRGCSHVTSINALTSYATGPIVDA